MKDEEKTMWGWGIETLKEVPAPDDLRITYPGVGDNGAKTKTVNFKESPRSWEDTKKEVPIIRNKLRFASRTPTPDSSLRCVKSTILQGDGGRQLGNLLNVELGSWRRSKKTHSGGRAWNVAHPVLEPESRSKTHQWTKPSEYGLLQKW